MPSKDAPSVRFRTTAGFFLGLGTALLLYWCFDLMHQGASDDAFAGIGACMVTFLAGRALHKGEGPDYLWVALGAIAALTSMAFSLV